jgi:hypothetical protein
VCIQLGAPPGGGQRQDRFGAWLRVSTAAVPLLQYRYTDCILCIVHMCGTQLALSACLTRHNGPLASHLLLVG